jgi:hypothetical protein
MQTGPTGGRNFFAAPVSVKPLAQMILKCGFLIFPDQARYYLFNCMMVAYTDPPLGIMSSIISPRATINTLAVIIAQLGFLPVKAIRIYIPALRSETRGCSALSIRMPFTAPNLLPPFPQIPIHHLSITWVLLLL